MGEIAEMMLDGFMCEQCGEIIGDLETGEGQGFPGLCAGCAALPENQAERKAMRGTHQPDGGGKPIRCRHCTRRFATAAAHAQHHAAKHGDAA